MEERFGCFGCSNKGILRIDFNKDIKQAGAELCQAQDQLGLIRLQTSFTSENGNLKGVTWFKLVEGFK